MNQGKKTNSAKIKQLKEQGVLNMHPEKVKDEVILRLRKMIKKEEPKCEMLTFTLPIRCHLPSELFPILKSQNLWNKG